jgi:VWFA-related protein
MLIFELGKHSLPRLNEFRSSKARLFLFHIVKATPILTALFLLFFASSSPAQDPKTQSRPQTEDERVVVNTSLVQVDAVVTDKNGKAVTNLQPADFELTEGGRARDITAFTYIPLGGKASTNKNPNLPANAVPPQLHGLNPDSYRRAIAILVDDFGLSAESIARLRSALEKFVAEQTDSTDVIAVVRSSGGPGAMAQFTSNPAQLLATIRRIRWYGTGRGGLFALNSMTPFDNNAVGVPLQGYSAGTPPDLSSREFFGGSLGALGFVIERLSKFPGRKSLVVISENLPLTSLSAQVSGATKVLDNLIALANQHSIVISTMDARGLSKPGLTTDDSQYNLAANQVEKKVRERNIAFTVAQDTLSYLAEQTGGTFVRNNNDLNNGLRRIVDSEQGYYLMAYRPDDADKQRSDRVYKVSVRLKRPELVLRSRSDFRRFAAQPEAIANPTKNDVLRDTLASPFVREDVRLKVTALFTGRLQSKVFVHVDARDLTLTEQSEGSYQGSFDLAVVAFDDNGKVSQDFARVQPVSVPPEYYEQVLRDGLVYTIDMPLPKPGPYQVRVAVRDADSGRLGSDSQFVDVPEARTSRLSVAGFIMQGMNTAISSGPAVRRFAPGDTLEYSALVYGVREDKNKSVSLANEIHLFRGTDEVLMAAVPPATVTKAEGNEAIVVGGTFKLADSLAPGEYFLQVTVTDQWAPRDRQTSTQWIDFEVVK